MDPNTRALLMGASGGATEKIYVEDVFSTWLYAGNNSTQTITNGIDISGKGGLVWIKNRTNNNAHHLFDTARGSTKILKTNSTDPQSTDTATLTGFSSSGFTLSDSTQVNGTNNYASWTFRKQQKFFDVVSWTGDGASSRTISHNLGSTPGFIIIKSVDYPGVNWRCWHRSISTGTLNGNDLLNLNLTNAANSVPYVIGSVSSTTFEIGNDSSVNQNYYTYVAYLFAHDAGGFGDSGNESVIKCGSYVDSGAGEVNLGWEPQWILTRPVSAGFNWDIYDNMRGWPVSGGNQYLAANNSNAENFTNALVNIRPTGFSYNQNDGRTYIYIAIRRGPMKTPTDATKVYTTATQGSAGDSLAPGYRSTFPVDFAFWTVTDSAGSNRRVMSRMQGINGMYSDLSNAEASFGSSYKWDYQNGFWDNTGTGTTTRAWMFRRAPGFFDVVCYTGNGSNPRTINHSLGVIPELMIVRNRTTPDDWWVYVGSAGITKRMVFNLNDAMSAPLGMVTWGNTAFTASIFGVGDIRTNTNTDNYVAYLFASCPGVSKVGSYTGTGTTLSVDCGFTNGARFVLIKRTDSTGDWYVWDTARGIVANNDPYLLLNSTAAEVTNTDYIDPLSSGFQISSTAPAAINANGGSYIYLAIA